MNYGALDEAVIEFQETYGLETIAASGQEGNGNAVNNLYGILAYPTFVVVGPDRTILKQQVSPATFEAFTTIIEASGGIPMNCNIGINEIQKAEFNVFPNPANNYVTINALDEIEYQSIKIYAADGKVALELYSLEAMENKAEIDITSLKAGFYFIEIVGSDGKIGVEKLIIQQ